MPGRIDLFSLLIPSCDTTIFHIGGWKKISLAMRQHHVFSHFLPCVHHIFAAGTCRSPWCSWEGVTLDNCMLDYYYTRFRWGFLCPSIISRHATISSPHLFTPRLMSHVTYIELVGLGQPNCVCLLDRSTAHHQFID
jgi:hypothetical protein